MILNQAILTKKSKTREPGRERGEIGDIERRLYCFISIIRSRFLLTKTDESALLVYTDVKEKP